MPVGRMVRGPGGRTLDEVWQGSPKAHLGTADAGLPEPVRAARARTPGLGHSSMVYMIESQVAYVIDALRTWTATAPTPCRCAPTRRSATTPTSTSACRARSGTRAARAGTSTRPAQRDAVARLDVALPAADGEFDPADFELDDGGAATTPRAAGERA